LLLPGIVVTKEAQVSDEGVSTASDRGWDPPCELPDERRRHDEWLRSLSLEERGKLIGAACRAASLIEQSRRASGLPPTKPAPWPPSTVALLKEYARRAREQ